jgi:hypothetical protein
MPQQSWSAKRERQYEKIKSGQQERGTSEDRAEEIAARTVNKERARSGESRQRSSTSTKDMSSGERGGHRSHSGCTLLDCLRTGPTQLSTSYPSPRGVDGTRPYPSGRQPVGLVARSPPSWTHLAETIPHGG